MAHTGELTGEQAGAASHRPAVTAGKPRRGQLCPTGRDRKTKHTCYQLSDTRAWNKHFSGAKTALSVIGEARIIPVVDFCIYFVHHKVLFLVLPLGFVSMSTADVKMLMSIPVTYYIFEILLFDILFSC